MQARNELVQANLLFVITVATKYQNRGVPLTDLISAGNMGLMTAVERFDSARGYKFITYAVWWIRQSIQTCLAEYGRVVRLPSNKVGLLWDISKAVRRLEQVIEGEPDAEAIADELDVPAQEVQVALLNAGAALSLDQAIDENDKYDSLDVLVDAAQEEPDAGVLRASVREQLQHVLRSLDEREQDILCRYLPLLWIRRQGVRYLGSDRPAHGRDAGAHTSGQRGGACQASPFIAGTQEPVARRVIAPFT